MEPKFVKSSRTARRGEESSERTLEAEVSRGVRAEPAGKTQETGKPKDPRVFFRILPIRERRYLDDRYN